MSFAPVEELIEAIAGGDMVVMVDDADRENEGDLIVAADAVTEQQVGFMIRHTSGIICVPMLGERLDDLRLPMMVTVNTDVRRTAFTISIDRAGDHHWHLGGRPSANHQGGLSTRRLDTTT